MAGATRCSSEKHTRALLCWIDRLTSSGPVEASSPVLRSLSLPFVERAYECAKRPFLLRTVSIFFVSSAPIYCKILINNKLLVRCDALAAGGTEEAEQPTNSNVGMVGR